MMQIILITLLFFFSISSQEETDFIDKLGKQIFFNEASNKEELLAFWSPHERFPSLGIGHTLWYPQGTKYPYTEQFPLLCQYMEKRGEQFPAWLKEALESGGAPWPDREAFYADTARLAELRQLLVKTISLQTRFMVQRFEEKIPLILEKTPPEFREQVSENIALLSQSSLGLYALIDYLNFKGDGLNPQEVMRNGQAWGLAAVVPTLPTELTQETAPKAFTLACAERLLMLQKNSAPEYRSLYAFEGWMKRLATYSSPKTFAEN